MTESSEITETPKPRVDWRTLSEQTGYKVLTLPDGSTLDAAAITGVRVCEADAGLSRIYSDARTIPRHVQVFGAGAVGLSTLAIVTEDVDDFFAMATLVHRRAATASQDRDRLRAAWGPDVTVARIDGPGRRTLTISNSHGEVLCRVEGDDLERRALAGAEFYASKVDR